MKENTAEEKKVLKRQRTRKYFMEAAKEIIVNSGWKMFRSEK